MNFILICNYLEAINRTSVVVSVALHRPVVYHHVRLNHCLVRHSAIHPLDRGSVEVDLVVNHEEGVVLVHDIVVNADPIQVLFEEALKEHVFLLEGGLLLVDRQLVKQHLVKPLVELVQQLEFVVLLLLHPVDFLNCHIRYFLHRVLVALVEGQHFLLLSLQLTTQLGRF